MKVLTTFILAVSLCLASVNYKFDIAQQAGVELITQSSGRFESRLARFQHHTRSHVEGELRRISPVVVIIDNIGTQDIDSVVIKYTYHLADGSTRTDVESLTRNLFNPGQLKPGQSIALYPRFGGIGNGSTKVKASALTSVVEELRHYTDIDISLDSVGLAGGKIIGPDTAGLRTMYDAQDRAIRDVKTEVESVKARDGSVDDYATALSQAAVPPLTSVPDAMKDFTFQYASTKSILGVALLHAPHAMEELFRSIQ
jgi:hypothetical protein